MAIQPLPLTYPDDTQQLQRASFTVNGILDGRDNAYGTATLASSTTTTSIQDRRVGISSVITLMPTTARAAAALTSVYVSARGQGVFTLTHDSQTYTDRVFAYRVGGA